MTKKEYQTTIETNLVAATNLCADLRKLRNLKKLAADIAAAKDFVELDALDKTIENKESELKTIRVELFKARRIVAKMEEIEAIEAGKVPLKPSKSTVAAKKGAAAKKTAPKGNQVSEKPAA